VIERRRREAQRRLEQLARRRIANRRADRGAGADLRAEAIAIRSELARLELVASLTTKLLQPLAAERVGPRPTPSGPPASSSGTSLRAASAGLTISAGERCPTTSE
jgi:hypothetical protein